MKDLYKLKQSDYEIGANLALKNAQSHLEVSKKASEMQQFGIATSILIIASEELAKASILKIRAINNSIRIDNLSDYFYSHSTKHKSIFKIFTTSLEYLENREPDTEKKLSISNKELLIIIAGISLFFALWEHFTKDNEVILKDSEQGNDSENTREKNSFEDMRQAGFYLGFNSDNRQWEIPNEIFNQDQYNTLKEIIEMAFDSIEKSLFGFKINSKNIVEFVDKLEDKKIKTEHLK